MKTLIVSYPTRGRESGSAVIVLMALLGIMLIFVAANTVAIRSLQRELKLVDKKQVQRLQSVTPTESKSK